MRPPTAGSSRASVASGKSNSSRPAVPPCVQHVIEKGGKPLYDAVRTWRRHTAAPPRVCAWVSGGWRVLYACVLTWDVRVFRTGCSTLTCAWMHSVVSSIAK